MSHECLTNLPPPPLDHTQAALLLEGLCVFLVALCRQFPSGYFFGCTSTSSTSTVGKGQKPPVPLYAPAATSTSPTPARAQAQAHAQAQAQAQAGAGGAGEAESARDQVPEALCRWIRLLRGLLEASPDLGAASAASLHGAFLQVSIEWILGI